MHETALLACNWNLLEPLNTYIALIYKIVKKHLISFLSDKIWLGDYHKIAYCITQAVVQVAVQGLIDQLTMAVKEKSTMLHVPVY